jgi:molecular chaperone DnaK (HSP70)
MKLGIDLGSTFTLAAYIARDGVPTLVPDAVFRKDATPSAIFLGQPGTALAGWHAEARFEQDPENTRLLTYFKRQFGNPIALAIDNNGNEWNAETLAALLLKKIRFDAEKHLGERIDGAIITVPAHFNDLQRKSVQIAAALANIPLLGLLDEPVAAALHYGVSAAADKDRVFFVYDLGGGTFDATVLGFHPTQGIDVLSQDGHSTLGGREFDDILQNFIAAQISKDFPDSFNWSAFALLQLRRAAEEIKIDLSDPARFFIKKTIIIGNWNKEVTFNRRDFEAYATALIEKTVEISKRCIYEADIDINRISDFLLVGGASQKPMVKSFLAKGLGIDINKIKSHQPMRAVAFGAALYAAKMGNDNSMATLPEGFRGVTGYHAGIRTIDTITGAVKVDVLIRKNTSLKSKGVKTYVTRAADQDHILLDLVQFFDNPDNAISLGQILIGPIQHPRLNYEIEVCLEHTSDGRLAIRATDFQSGREIKHVFANSDVESARFLQQKDLVDSTLINLTRE